ncbi:MAG: alanine dehydrogenase [Pseudomonadota bacterium]
MKIGCPKEIKNHEYRVGLTPTAASELIRAGHDVMIEAGAGAGIGADDTAYIAMGASVVDTAEEVFASSDMIVKVKEPQAVERKMLREGQLLYTYLHLAPDPEQTRDLVDSGAICIAYETVTSSRGGLPLLAPMSEVAGRLSIQAGMKALEKPSGGRGLLLAGVPGVEPAKVVVIGGGVVGRNAAEMAVGMRADVTVLDRNVDTLRALDAQFDGRAKTVYSTHDALERHVLEADLVIGAVLIPGASAPKLVTRDMIGGMNPGSVLVDVAIDQGGCFETSYATTHAEPTYEVEGVVHYCVANMPGAVPRTSTYALNNATIPYALELANKGFKQALLDDAHLRNGLNVIAGKIAHEEVGESLGIDVVDPVVALKAA